MKPPITSAKEALTEILTLVLTAPDDKSFQEASDIALEIIDEHGLTRDDVRQSEQSAINMINKEIQS